MQSGLAPIETFSYEPRGFCWVNGFQPLIIPVCEALSIRSIGLRLGSRRDVRAASASIPVFPSGPLWQIPCIPYVVLSEILYTRVLPVRSICDSPCVRDRNTDEA